MLAQQLLRRSELAADYAIVALESLVQYDAALCDDKQRNRFKDLVASKGVIKGVVQLDNANQVVCSDQAGGTVIREMLLRDVSYQGSNQDVALMPGWPEGNGTFAVVWRVSLNEKFLVVLNIDLLMFDIFPARMRDTAEAAIFIDRHMVAHFEPSTQTGAMALQFDAASLRYPLSARVRISESNFVDWDGRAGFLGGMVGALTGLSISLVCG